MSELEILFPDPVAVGVMGRDVKIMPVKLRHFERYGKQATAVLELFGSAGVQQINRYAATHSGEIKKLLRVTTDLNWFQLWRMPATVAIQLLVQVVRVNSGFFVEALPEMVRALTGPLSPNA